jgi:hypothetical protein
MKLGGRTKRYSEVVSALRDDQRGEPGAAASGKPGCLAPPERRGRGVRVLAVVDSELSRLIVLRASSSS